MTARFETLTDRIYRLKVPFENIYTAVFLIKTARGYMLVDCATTKDDVDTVIMPALDLINVKREEITHILITHPHGDHAGGLRHILPYMAEACVCAGSNFIKERLAPASFMCVSDGQQIDDGIMAVSLQGHCADMIGYLDTRTRTLISGDGLQEYGVGRYGCGLGSCDSYLCTLDKVAGMDIDTLIASHDYYPHGSTARGREEISRYVNTCREYAIYIMRISDENTSRGITDEKIITDTIRENNTTVDPDIPPLQYSTVKNYISRHR